ncbi:MAG: hypothetical protein ACJAXS_002851, partial [Colwellia sp.]
QKSNCELVMAFVTYDVQNVVNKPVDIIINGALFKRFLSIA